jgi:hypothetical protein
MNIKPSLETRLRRLEGLRRATEAAPLVVMSEDYETGRIECCWVGLGDGRSFRGARAQSWFVQYFRDGHVELNSGSVYLSDATCLYGQPGPTFEEIRDRVLNANE